jgi:mRNA interferase RelE/StbE
LKYAIRITDTGLDLMRRIPDRRIQREILNRIERLSREPDKQGKNLVKDLCGFRSVHAARRHWIIYKIDKQTVVVYVLAAGIRKEGDKKDIYEVAKRLLDAGLLDLDEPETWKRHQNLGSYYGGSDRNRHDQANESLRKGKKQRRPSYDSAPPREFHAVRHPDKKGF